MVDAQIEMSCDLLINKIMFYLSQLPVQLTFHFMRPKLHSLCEYMRFVDYLSALPQQTDQMKATRVMYTDMPQGLNEIPKRCSYLKKKFFDEYPTEKPERLVQSEKDAQIKSVEEEADDYKKVKEEDENANEEDPDAEEDENKTL